MSDKEKKLKIVGIDLDDVIFDFQGALHPYHNNKYGTNIERAYSNDFDLWNLWHCTKEESVRRIFEFYESPEHWQSKPIQGALEGVRTLKDSYNLVVVTAKPEALKDRTLKWIDKHFKDIFHAIHFTNQFHGNGPKRQKSEICKELGIQVFIDDSFYNAKEISESGIPVFLFDTPWNQNKTGELITRVFSWEDIVQRLSSPNDSIPLNL